MQKFTCILIFIFLLFSSSIWAQENATIKGNIKDIKTGEPIFGANVVASKGIGTTTDFDGNFNFKLDPGTYELKISFVSYQVLKKEITLAAGEELVLNEKLAPSVTELGTTVISASKYEKKLSEETVTIAVLGNDLIKNSGSLQAEDALEKVPGVTIVEGQANIRGGSGWSFGAGSRVAVLLDEMSILSADAGDAKWSAMPMEMVEQVEVIKGAASSLYGSSALNGIINVRTLWPKSEPETKILMTAGVFQNYDIPNLSDSVSETPWFGRNLPNTTAIQAVHSRRLSDEVDLVIGGAYLNNTGTLVGNGNTDTRISGKLRYRPKGIRGLSTGLMYNVNNNFGSTFFIWAGPDSLMLTPFPGTVSQFKTLRVNFDVWVNYLDKNNNSYSFKTRYFNSKNTNNTGQGSIPQQYFGEFQYQRRFLPIALNIVGGISGYYNWVKAPGGGSLLSLDKIQANNLSAYFQADKKFFDKLSITFGIRYERFEIENFSDDSKAFIGDTKIPFVLRFGANYQVAEATYIRTSIGQGYRFPTIAEKFVNTSVGGVVNIFPNPKIEPETGWSAEVAIKQGIKMGNWMGYVDASFFANLYKNMMEFTFGQFGLLSDPLLGLGFSSQNIGKTRILGGELEFLGTGKLTDKITMNILAGYTYIEPKSRNWNDTVQLFNVLGEDISRGKTYAETSSSSKNVLKYRNKHTVKLDVEFLVMKERLGMAVSVQYLSFMKNIDGAFVNEIAGFEGSIIQGTAFSSLLAFREKIDRGNTRIDPRISYKINDKAKITFIVKNALNQFMMIRPALVDDPRSYNMQLQVTF